MKLGSSDISAVKIGSTDVNKVYIGSTEVWSSFTGLLDTYTGAAAAYSLRQLKSGVTNAIEVRRASDNTTQDIGFVNGELDTTSLASFCSGTNGFVTTWYDQSGNGNDASQSTASEQPQIVSSGSVITENGKPAVKFNGSGGSSSVDRFTLSSSSLVDVTNDLSIFSVITPTQNPASQDGVWTQLSSALNSNVNYMAYGFRDGGYFTRQVTTSTISLDGLDTTSQSQTLISDVVDWSAETNSFKANETIGTDVNAGRSTTSTSPIVIGARPDGAYSVNIHLQEFVFWDSNQSSNRTGIETNINDFYSIY